jgi:site-specific DNA-methyltransferase (adenine-specific)
VVDPGRRGHGRLQPYYEDDAVTIYHGEAGSTLAQLATASVDLLLTDPPYSSGGMFRGDRATDPAAKYTGWSHTPDGTHKPAATYGTFGGDNKDQWAWIRWVTGWSGESLRVVRPSGQAFMFSDWRQLPAATDAMQFGGWTWRGVVVWDKGVARPIKGQFRNHLEYIIWASHGALPAGVEGYPSALISVPTVGRNEREHVTQKPVRLLRELIRVCSAPTPTILDPFMGSGSALLAAREMGCRVIGIEIEERYCEIAAKRCAQDVLDLGAVA